MRNTESEPPTDIDSTEVAVDATVNSEFTNYISNCGPTTISTEVPMDFELEVDSTNPVDHASSDHNNTNVLETAKQNLVKYSTTIS